MVALKEVKELTLLEGETLVDGVQGDAWNDSPNPIARLISAIAKILWLILGIRLRTYVVVTNLRIVQIERKTILWGLLKGNFLVLTLNRNSISSVGYGMQSSWFISRKYYFALANASGLTKITYKGSKEQLAQFCSNLDKLIASSNNPV